MFLSSAVSISIFPSFSPFSMPSSTSPSIKTLAPSPLSSAFCAGLEADPLLLDSDFLSRGRPGVAIMWCCHCVEDNEVVREPNQDCVYCSVCGKILGCFVYKRHRMSGKPKRNKGLRGRPANIGNLSDFDDLEVAQYLYNEKEKHLRKIIWEEMHKECLQEQAANGASQDRMADGFEELISTQDLEKMVATALVKSRKEKKRKHPTDSKSSTSTTSHRHKLKKKSFNSKINYKALESSCKGDKKKQVAASKIGECENDEIKTIEETRKESEESAVNNVEDLINVDDDNIDNDYYNDEDDGYYGNEEDDSYEKPDEDYYDE